MQSQDSSNPSGVSGGEDKQHQSRTSVSRARQRKSIAAIQMRLAGATWTEIALTLGYPTPRTAMVAVERALEKELRGNEDREAMRRIAGARLERLLRSVWSKAIDESHPEHLIAATKAKEVIAEHARLFGLNAPAEMIVHSPTQTELEHWVALVMSSRTAAVEEADILDGEVIDDPPALEAS